MWCKYHLLGVDGGAVNLYETIYLKFVNLDMKHILTKKMANLIL